MLNSVKIAKNKPHYTSTRAWLDHLRLMAELPYPSWALMPSIGEIVRAHIDSAVMNFGWADTNSLQPLATWVNPLKPNVYKRFLASPQDVFDDIPIKAMRDSRGRFLQMVEAMPNYEEAPIYQHMLKDYKARWGLSTVIQTNQWLGFMTMYRQDDLGPYSENDWKIMADAGLALSQLDQESSLANLPASELHDVATSTMLLDSHGQIVAQSPEIHNLLFISRQTGMGPPEWARDDWFAMPPQVTALAQKLFDTTEPNGRAVETQHLPWGRFDYILEKMQTQENQPKSIMTVTIRHHEPLDITIARRLWGWPMSPQEKRIIIASARQASIEQIAQILEISSGTLKNYSNELLARFNLPSRNALVKKILSGVHNFE